MTGQNPYPTTQAHIVSGTGIIPPLFFTYTLSFYISLTVLTSYSPYPSPSSGGHAAPSAHILSEHYRYNNLSHNLFLIHCFFTISLSHCVDQSRSRKAVTQAKHNQWRLQVPVVQVICLYRLQCIKIGT